MIIDATNKVVGRIATVAAKQALLGEEISIVNCEKAIVTGKRAFVLADAKRRRDQGTFKGPFISSKPDRYVRRVIRGMLPYRQEKGRKAYQRVLCYIGMPKTFEGKETLDVGHADAAKTQNLYKVTIGDICRHLGDTP
ncbi:50S ribosomal protein L13 [Candidatus Woesearchaeota archaeon]|nr:50S ribosomal protein L13 [Candidatus Woesearchaeota archaeon]